MRLRPPPLRSLVRPHLPGRTVRSRLTLLYGGLFLLSGAVLLFLTTVLWGNVSGGGVGVSPRVSARVTQISGQFVVPHQLPFGSGILSGGRPLNAVREVLGQLNTVAANQHANDLHRLLLYSAIALGIMAVLAMGLGWIVAGRVLRPLRTITEAVRDISATNLHERLDLEGPADELKVLGDTFDQLLERLDGSFQSQRQFVANASHELRTPLATMRASLDVALAKPEPIPEQTIKLATRLHAELDHIDRLLESFLALARAQHGSADGVVPLSLDLLAASALERHAGIIADLALDVEEEDCPAAWVSGNETLLTRMVDNVIDNAVRHNKHGGWIHVRTDVVDNSARLVVENGGAVLDEDAVVELTKPFRRVGTERTGSGDEIGRAHV